MSMVPPITAPLESGTSRARSRSSALCWAWNAYEFVETHDGAGERTVKRILRCFVMIMLLSFTVTAWSAPVHLRCEYVVNPLGIDQSSPRLSWQSNNSERNWKQAAYQILVASTPELLSAGNADIWDSGRNNSDESVDIAYRGPALESRRRYYWKVRVWDAAGQTSESDESAWWEMGLLHPEDWKAKWIAWKNPE